MGALLFWPIVGAVALSMIWSGFLSRREIERTIRLAIERGQVLDAETVRRLKAQSGRTPDHMFVGGVVLVALAFGTAIFAWAASYEDTDALVPLSGIAAMIGLPGASLIVCGRWLMRRREDVGRD